MGRNELKITTILAAFILLVLLYYRPILVNIYTFKVSKLGRACTAAKDYLDIAESHTKSINENLSICFNDNEKLRGARRMFACHAVSQYFSADKPFVQNIYSAYSEMGSNICKTTDERFIFFKTNEYVNCVLDAAIIIKSHDGMIRLSDPLLQKHQSCMRPSLRLPDSTKCLSVCDPFSSKPQETIKHIIIE